MQLHRKKREGRDEEEQSQRAKELPWIQECDADLPSEALAVEA
jgi:hypothetical protein